MRVIKLIITGFFILSCFGFCLAQTGSAKSEAEIKALENKLKEEAKAKEKAEKAKQKSKKKENNFDVVGQFPDQFVGQNLRFKDVPVTIESVTKAGTTTYYVEFYTPKWKRFTTARAANVLSFTIADDIGHGVLTFFKEYASSNQIRTHVTVDISSESGANGEKFYIATVKCIELLGVFGQKFKKLGTCE